MSRAFALLDRLPAHLEATRPGKLLGDVTAALARDLDVLARSGGRLHVCHVSTARSVELIRQPQHEP